MAHIHYSSPTTAPKVDADTAKGLVWVGASTGAHLSLQSDQLSELIAQLQRAAQQLTKANATVLAFSKAEAA